MKKASIILALTIIWLGCEEKYNFESSVSSYIVIEAATIKSDRTPLVQVRSSKQHNSKQYALEMFPDEDRMSYSYSVNKINAIIDSLETLGFEHNSTIELEHTHPDSNKIIIEFLKKD